VTTLYDGKPQGLMQNIHTVLEIEALHHLRGAVADLKRRNDALDMIEWKLTHWFDGSVNPIKGADEAIKKLAECLVRDRKIARLKAELAALEAE
jgi:hypothetical protein